MDDEKEDVLSKGLEMGDRQDYFGKKKITLEDLG